jgi:hypothetical protein
VDLVEVGWFSYYWCLPTISASNKGVGIFVYDVTREVFVSLSDFAGAARGNPKTDEKSVICFDSIFNTSSPAASWW